jgi:cancer susceptibility candidate protein 1
MRCNGLPNASDPSDLRKYVHMWKDEKRKANEKEINWMLKSNEQSFLTQDQSVPDLSRENMKKIQSDIGGKYAKRASEVLGILDEIDAVIRDRFSLSPSRLDDLLDVSEIALIQLIFGNLFPLSLSLLPCFFMLPQLKSEIRAVLSSYVNEFTFKILSNIERNMSLSGLTQARYKFESPVFVNELYALRDIPLPQPT